MVTKYAILPSGYVEGDVIEYKTITDGKITNDVLVDNDVEDFKFEPYTIRVYFEWYSDDDETDTSIQNLVDSYKIIANITFKQLI